MKYIKKYTRKPNYTDEDTDLLSEYLQEFFDTFNIKFRKNGEYITKDYDDIYWDIYYNLGCICIYNIQQDINEIIKEIKRLIQPIEKRLNKKLKLEQSVNSNLYISINQ